MKHDCEAVRIKTSIITVITSETLLLSKYAVCMYYTYGPCHRDILY